MSRKVPDAGGAPAAAPRQPSGAMPSFSTPAIPGYDSPTEARPQGTPPAKPEKHNATVADAQTATPTLVKKVLDLGMSYVGTPYVWGGAAPGGFDCSGLLQWIYLQNGVALPRVAAEQAKAGVAVAAKDAQPGDLIAFDNNKSRPGVDHIGIYLGNGKMLQAPHTGANVPVVNVNLAGATTIRRVVGQQALADLPRGANGKYTYQAAVTPGATPPKQITPAVGGGDPGSTALKSGAGLTSLLTTGTVAPATGAATADVPPVLPKDASPTAIYNYVARYYPDIVPYLHDKELGPILLQAAQGGWSDARLQGALSKTNFWKKNAASQRAWDLQGRTDRATQSLAVDNQKQEILDRASKLGYTIDPLVAHDLAVTGLRNGWSGTQFDDAIKTHGPVAVKQNTTNVSGLKSAAAQWMVPVSDATLNKWSADIQAGNVTTDDFTTYLKEQAKSLFPTLAGAIDRGVTVQQYTDPYRQTAAQLLETDPTQIDLMHDPKFSKALFNTDPKTGARTQMSLSDWQQYLRTTPDYGKTAQAKDQAAKFATTLAQTFGALA